MRATISSTSPKLRPRSNASKKRGGSKMLRRTASTLPSRMLRSSELSPSTRAMYSTWIVLFAMGLALLPERLSGRIEGAEDASDVALCHTQRGELARDCGGVRTFGGSEAAIAASAVGWADCAAAGLGNGAEARCSLRHHDANRPAQFAFVAHAVAGDRRVASDQKSLNHLEQLALVDRAATQFEINRHMGADRRRGRKRLQVFGARVDGSGEFADIGKVSQSLDAAR